MKWFDIRDFEIQNRYSDINLKKLNLWLDNYNIKNFSIEFGIENINRLIKKSKLKLLSLPDKLDHKILFKNQNNLYLVYFPYFPTETIHKELEKWCTTNQYLYHIEQDSWYNNATTVIIKLI